MSSIDNRIVSMQFDNAGFASKMGDTLKALEKLNTTLADVGTKNGLDGLARAAKNVDMAPLAASVEGVSAKFLAMSTIAVAALATIVHRAVDAGLQFSRAFTVAPVTAGFSEFELKMGSIQTIMAGSGADLATVNKKLQELNTYSDKTIYSFADMTSNIGKFTNAGVSLDDSVAAIQGVANVAAISGANAGEASRAMYNFGQALGSGSVKLMDWKSIELANMATVEFKQELIDSAVALGTLTKTQDGYVTASGTSVSATKGFNESLSEAWLSSEALTDTLGRYSDASTDIGARATAAAQDVKTFSQMMDTVKESAGSGWSQTWEIIIGDFEEGKKLWTDINNTVSGWIGNSAAARNELLQDWSDLGGRTKLIDGLRKGFEALGTILTPIKQAFRDIFPAMTAARLYALTVSFGQFMDRMSIGLGTMAKVRAVFRGLFAILEIGWTVLKEGVGFVVDFFKALAGEGSGGKALSFLQDIGNFFTGLNEKLVDGGGIADFFDKLSVKAEGVAVWLRDLAGRIQEFLPSFSDIGSKAQEIIEKISGLGDKVRVFIEAFKTGGISAALAVFDDLKGRVGNIGDAFGNIGDLWAPFKAKLEEIGGVLDGVWEGIKTWFSTLGDKISEIFGTEEFDGALSVINIGFLGGILLLLRKFVNEGLKIDIGDGFLSGVTGTLNQLTDTLKAMETNVKAGAIMKIAAAMVVLVLSLMLLASMDADALTRSFAAMGTGFGILIGAFATLNLLVSGPGTALKMTTLATGLVLLAGAMLIMSLAVKLLSTLSWDELLRGMLGLAGILAVMVLAAKPLSSAAPGLIRAGVGIGALGVGLMIVAGAVAIFATMELDTIGKGLLGVAGSLLVIGISMRLMPKNMLSLGAGLILVGLALTMISGVVAIFGHMDMDTMGKGLYGVAASLVLIAVSMKLMPKNMLATAAGLLLVSVALGFIVNAMESFGAMSLEEIGRGIVGMGGSLVILALALMAMSGTLGGAIALGIAAVSLRLFAEVVEAFASLSIGQLLSGLLGIAGVLAVVGGAAILLTPAIPVIAALGAAMLLLGAAFALFGFGAAAVASAFLSISKIGSQGLKTLISVIDILVDALPKLMQAFVEGLLGMVVTITENIPLIVEALTALLVSLLDAIIELLPKIGETVSVLITTLLTLIAEKVPEFIETGWAILVAFLQGIRDNIAEVTVLVGEIITQFLDAFSTQIPGMATSLVEFVTTLWTTVANAMGQLVPVLMIGVGAAFLSGLWEGIKSQTAALFEVIGGIISDIIDFVMSGFGIFSPSRVFMDIGGNLMQGLINGVVDGAVAVMNWFMGLAGKVLGWIGDLGRTLWDKGSSLLTGMLIGVINGAVALTSWFTHLASKVLTWVGDVARTLWEKGSSIIGGMMTGVVNGAIALTFWFATLPGKVIGWIGNVGSILYSVGKDLIQGLINGIKDMAGSVASAAVGIARGAKNAVTGFLGISSPSKVFKQLGVYTMEGFVIGIRQGGTEVIKEAKDLTRSMTRVMSDLSDSLINSDMSSPVITPVMDLTRIAQDAKTLSGMVGGGGVVSPTLSYEQARNIASTSTRLEDQAFAAAPSEVKFEQNIYAPKQLSNSDIYKQTRNQITMAKEELSIPS